MDVCVIVGGMEEVTGGMDVFVVGMDVGGTVYVVVVVYAPATSTEVGPPTFVHVYS